MTTPTCSLCLLGLALVTVIMDCSVCCTHPISTTTVTHCFYYYLVFYYKVCCLAIADTTGMHSVCLCVCMIDKQGEREGDERGMRYRREGDGGRKGEKSKDFSLLDLL